MCASYMHLGTFSEFAISQKLKEKGIMRTGTVQFDSALFLGATFRQENCLKGWKLDRATGSTRRSTAIPHCRGHSHLATQLLPDPRQSISGSKGRKTWPGIFSLTMTLSLATCWLPEFKALLALLMFFPLKNNNDKCETLTFFFI